MKQNKTFIIALTGVMVALSVTLKFFNIALPIFPGFLKIDLALFPSLLTGFVFHPLVGAGVVLVTELIHLLFTSTAGIGELMDFLVGTGFVLTASFIYHTKENRKSALLGLLCGTVVMAVVGGTANYFLALPLYSLIGITIPAIISMCQEVLPFIDSKLDAVLFSFVPFNLLKGIILSLLLYLGYEIVSAVKKVKR